jgi:thiamine transport system permease protein
MALAASPLVIGTGLFILLFPLATRRAGAAGDGAGQCRDGAALRAARLLPALRQARPTTGGWPTAWGMRGWRGCLRLVTAAAAAPAAGLRGGLAAALSMGDLGVIVLFADPEGRRCRCSFIG